MQCDQGGVSVLQKQAQVSAEVAERFGDLGLGMLGNRKVGLQLVMRNETSNGEMKRGDGFFRFPQVIVVVLFQQNESRV